jgi:hypothetical protein
VGMSSPMILDDIVEGVPISAVCQSS